MMRECYKLEDKSLKIDIKQQILFEFRKHQDLSTEDTASSAISHLLVQGERSLDQLRSLRSVNNLSNQSGDVHWADIQDDDDKRGRVGTKWPWQR